MVAGYFPPLRAQLVASCSQLCDPVALVEVSAPPSSRRVAVFGATGSGKTRWLQSIYWPVSPRLVIVDQTGEWMSQADAIGAQRCENYAELMDALARNSYSARFRIVCELYPDDVEALGRKLVPVPGIDRSPVRALGGMTLMLDEVDRVVSAGYVGSLRDIWRRGRHAGLNVLAASQRPCNVSKEVTSNSDVIAILRLHEPNDVAYLADALGSKERANEAVEWARSAPHRVAVYYTKDGKLAKLEPATIRVTG